MTTEINSFSTDHTDLIHDAKFDYYGKRLATCSSDTTIKIFEVSGNNQKQVAVLNEHTGPVWAIDWSHPKFGSFLASCSYDHKVIIWQEQSSGRWKPVFTYTCKSSVNSVAWAPPECGLCLACASSDCSIIIVNFDMRNDQWAFDVLNNAHQIGCTAVSWASATPIGSITKKFDQPSPAVKRFVSGGCDNKAIIWRWVDERWKKECELEEHVDWVRDVAWAPNIGLPCETIATCGQDKNVIIWTKKLKEGEEMKDEEEDEEWKKKVIKMKNVVWKVSWSVTGNILAVTTADNEVKLFKENLSDGNWEPMGNIKD